MNSSVHPGASFAPFAPDPSLVEKLARAVARREGLPHHELPRCRREVSLQLELLRPGAVRVKRKRPVAFRRSSAA